MPRPRPIRTGKTFPTKKHSLSEAARKQLAAQLPGVDAAAFIPAVEYALGIYMQGQQHLDNIPRPAHYRMAFKPMARDASKILKTLKGWPDWFRDQFGSRRVDLGEIEKHLFSLKTVSEDVLKGVAGKSSKGAQPHTALCETIRHLRRVFRDCDRDHLTTTRSRRGAFQFRADWEERELKFVGEALRDARIFVRGDGYLLPLFRDSRCQSPTIGAAERLAELDRLAERTFKARQHPSKRRERTPYPEFRDEPRPPVTKTN